MILEFTIFVSLLICLKDNIKIYVFQDTDKDMECEMGSNDHHQSISNLTHCCSAGIIHFLPASPFRLFCDMQFPGEALSSAISVSKEMDGSKETSVIVEGETMTSPKVVPIAVLLSLVCQDIQDIYNFE